MSKRHVWVIEGRNKQRRGLTPFLWRIQQGSHSRKAMLEHLRLYRDGRNPRAEFRLTKYVPEKP